MAVFLFIKINEVEEFKKIVINPTDPTGVVDTEGLQAKLKAKIGSLKDDGVLPSGGGAMSLLEAIDELEKWNKAYHDAFGKLAYAVSAESSDGVTGQALLAQAKRIQGDALRAKQEAVNALGIAPLAGVAGTETRQPESLKQAINEMKVHIEALVADYKTKVAKIESLEADVVTAKQGGADEVTALKAAFDTAKTAKDTQIADLQKQVADALAQTDKVRGEYEGARKAHNTDIVDYKGQIQEKVNKIIALDSRLVALSKRLERALAREFEPDGVVMTLKPGETTGYIDRGSAHSVFNGLTFSVFDPRELGKAPPVPKGRIRLTKVMGYSSEFVIVGHLPSNPIVEGDIITNPAYDLKRPFHFALVGKFDIGNDRAEDTSHITQLIKDFGGKVQKEISVETDYLVVGDDPMNWAPKGSGPQVQVIRKKLQDEQKKMGLATDMARRLHIPVLNLNRFMSLMGQ
jgi:BRCA1 C Terminus (BRCT) domain